MGIGFFENMQSMVVFGIFIAIFVAVLFAFVYSKNRISDVSMRGAQLAISDRILASECLYESDVKNMPQARVFSKSALDSFNNSAIPCLKLLGSQYFMKVEANGIVWYLESEKRNPYIYNAALRGVTRGCIDNRAKQSISEIDTGSDGFDYASGRNLITRYALVRDGANAYSAKVSLVIDADSAEKSAMYPQGRPLCICDIVCPSEACVCMEGCGKQSAAEGEMCS